MESTAFNQAGWNPLHLIGMHFTTLHGIYCIQSRCMEFTAFNWDPLRHDAWNPLRSIKIHCTTLHGIHCMLSRSIGPRCIESTAFNRDPFSTLHGYTGFNRDAFYHAASNPLHSVTLHGIHCSQSGSIVTHCRETTAFNRHPLHHAAWNPMRSI